ncbi:MAG: hypothetical protein U9N59_16585 [Campylobacterota bacterium]|nr:hypothetical protein [Campylobacterota bacterium]
MNYEDLKKEIFQKIKTNRVLNRVEELLGEKAFKNSHNYEKLLKQLSYDFLVYKRRNYKQEDLKSESKDKKGKYYQCENPANFPEANNPFDKTKHIDCLTAWTEDWEKIECQDIKFDYLKNLDADIIILGKDSTGQESYKPEIEELKKTIEKLTENKNTDEIYEEVSKYINKEIDISPYENKDLLEVYRYGFSSKDVKTNTNLRWACSEYLKDNEIENKYSIGDIENGKIVPKENENIFLTNSFVFLSACKMSPSIIPDEIFKKSLNEFIVPLFEIIKPKTVIQGGTEAIVYSRDGVNDLIDNCPVLKEINIGHKERYHNHKNISYPLQRLLNCTHDKMSKMTNAKEFLYHIQWNKDEITYFYPINHPSRPKIFYSCDSEEDGYYVWKHINKYLN